MCGPQALQTNINMLGDQVKNLVLCLLLLPFSIMAQPANDDCSTAGTLCANGDVLSGDNSGASAGFNFCPNIDNAVWYSFTTNSVGGAVDVSISSINCPNIAGMDNQLQGVILSGDPSCDPALFSAASSCELDSMEFDINATGLLANTEYWVMITGVSDGPGATVPAQCGFDISFGGPGAEIIDVDFDAGEDQEIGPGQVTQLNATGGTTYDWSPTTGLSGNGIPDPFASPSETTVYSVTTTINGCVYTDMVTITVVQLISAPNTFTPNSDGINDFWEIDRIAEFPRADVIIYDRWGQVVFKSIGYSTPWDGTRNGTTLPTATYYYYINLNKTEGNNYPYTSSITIVR